MDPGIRTSGIPNKADPVFKKKDGQGINPKSNGGSAGRVPTRLQLFGLQTDLDIQKERPKGEASNSNGGVWSGCVCVCVGISRDSSGRGPFFSPKSRKTRDMGRLFEEIEGFHRYVTARRVGVSRLVQTGKDGIQGTQAAPMCASLKAPSIIVDPRQATIVGNQPCPFWNFKGVTLVTH